MTRIVAGLFEEQVAAQRAIDELKAHGVDPKGLSTFVVSPPGMRHGLPLGGDQPADEAAQGGEHGAMRGAAIGGAAGIAAGALAAPLVGPAGIAAGIGVGAYVGALAGATKSMGENNEEAATIRPGGVMVAVDVDRSPQDDVVDTLRDAGAKLIEVDEGVWRNGQWVDFDPVRPPREIVQLRGNPNYPT